MDTRLQDGYNAVPYPSGTFTKTHPNRLAVVASLLGMAPVPIESCRVLELGCASGGNLTPMAVSLPGSEFVGVDFAARQIQQGRAVVRSLGLTNIRLEQVDMMDIDASWGQFDYIIAHGVYSWVPPEVRDKLLAICKQNLSPNGIAYVSYNAYPGYTMLKMVRDMMGYHTRHIADPVERLAEARAFMEFLSEATPDDEAYGSFIKFYTQTRLNKEAEKYPGEESLIHDDLELVNDPVYFYEFVQHSAAHGLQYLGEARFSTMMSNKFPVEMVKMLNRFSKTVIDYEQYLDFLRNRSFRETLLCHEGIPLTRKLKPDCLTRLYVAVPSKPVSGEPDIVNVSVEKFEADDGAVFSTDHPLTKAAMLYLAKRWPQPVSFDNLVSSARSLLESQADPAKTRNPAPATDDDATTLATNLLTAYSYSSSLVELSSYIPNFTLDIGERPVASGLARLQAQVGQNVVTNLRHQRVELDQMEQYILSRLDGNHNHADLIEQLLTLFLNGKLNLEQKGQPVKDEQQARTLLTVILHQTLRRLAHSALLMHQYTTV